MQLSWDDLTIDISAIDTSVLFHNWQWLIGKDKHVMMITSLGDAFLQDIKGYIFWLDVAQGQMHLIADSYDTFQLHLQKAVHIDEWFSPELISELKQQGLHLAPQQIYAHQTPVLLGGKSTLTNVKPADIMLHFQTMGLICQQVKNITTGTQVNGASLCDN
ncbi:T6SS immunity protein Tdi1 domain-containing protein [Xanthocytophaga flava]|uniref:T6SS immunity protein Tdi1 domain-containing protein n=1 Tax=Xanthocytophaga flava TaxID=3048013 RepID=UPI0028D41651|nr:T6SS immunity protein Tdi1 domain-containing protein [Xanthocytophaga flavus]MDJ1467014.1 DUF1851 domain-containing protein [Xanthocytophaga flavus]